MLMTYRVAPDNICTYIRYLNLIEGVGWSRFMRVLVGGARALALRFPIKANDRLVYILVLHLFKLGVIVQCFVETVTRMDNFFHLEVSQKVGQIVAKCTLFSNLSELQVVSVCYYDYERALS